MAETVDILKGAEQVYYELKVAADGQLLTAYAILRIVENLVQLDSAKDDTNPAK